MDTPKVKRIKLTKDKYAKVSAEDFVELSKYKWCASNESRGGLKWYAIRWVQRKDKKGKVHRSKIRMHRLILGLPPGKHDSRVVDHINHDGLDNRRENLRILDSNSENMSHSPGWRKKRPTEEPSL